MSIHSLSQPEDLIRFNASQGELGPYDAHIPYKLAELPLERTGSVSAGIQCYSTAQMFACIGEVSASLLGEAKPPALDTLHERLGSRVFASAVSANTYQLAYADPKDVSEGLSQRIRLADIHASGRFTLDIVTRYYTDELDDAMQLFHFKHHERATDAAIMSLGRCVARLANLFYTGKTRHDVRVVLPGIQLQKEPANKELVPFKESVLPHIHEVPQADTEKRQAFPTFEDFGGLQSQIQQLRDYIEELQVAPEIATRYGQSRPNAILLQGPGGVGKTELVKALANELSAEYKTVSISDILRKYIGEPVQAIRQAFTDAAASERHVVLFFDECDGILHGGGNEHVGASIIAEFKSIMNVMDATYPNVTLVFAANSLAGIDPALLRAGRIDLVLKIKEPDTITRAGIFSTFIARHQEHYRLLPSFDTVEDIVSSGKASPDEIRIDELAAAAEGFTAADIKATLNLVLKRNMLYESRHKRIPPQITHSDIVRAINQHRASRPNDV